jgi:chromosome partitioning protein
MRQEQMAQDPEEALPPYFGISPDEALAELGPPVGTRDLAGIAALCARGRDDLVGRGHEAGGRKTLRLFSTWEITRYLIPVAQAHFRRVLRANPALPQGRSETQGGAKWFSLDEVLRLRAHFAAEGSRTKPYAPWRPAGLPAKIAAIANFKGGVGKTSMAAHLAMSAALDGYRVLVVDLDSQGSMTSIFGGSVASEWDTVFPLIARDYALGLQAENRRRAERGETPLPLEETLDAALEKTAADVIQKTHWPNVDLIGAQLNLYWAEFQIPVWRMSLRAWKLWEALGNAFERDGVLERYDLVILDTPPALGYLTINGLTAADILLVPLGASFLEFDSTGRFFDMLHSTFQSIEDGENMAARALGRPEIRFEWDAVRAVVTRYDAGQQAELASLMQAYLSRTLSPWRQDFTALVGQAGEQASGIYEADYRDFNRETYARGRQTFDLSYAAFKRLLLAAWRRDQLAEDPVPAQPVKEPA